MKISVTLPSIHEEALSQTLDNLEHATTTHEIEVLVVSPFSVKRDQVVWIEEREATGCVAGHAAAAARATGDLITAWTDDHDYAPGWDERAVENFLDREGKGPQPFSLGLRQVSATPRVGTVFGIYYPYFPVMRRAAISKVGGWFDAKRYTHGFSDPDLGLRVWFNGGRCEWADEMTVIPRPENDSRRSSVPDYFNDIQPFVDRWAPIYGRGHDLSNMRSWNVDRLVSELPEGARTLAP